MRESEKGEDKKEEEKKKKQATNLLILVLFENFDRLHYVTRTMLSSVSKRRYSQITLMNCFSHPAQHSTYSGPTTEASLTKIVMKPARDVVSGCIPASTISSKKASYLCLSLTRSADFRATKDTGEESDERLTVN
jgi:hypothetical protein